MLAEYTEKDLREDGILTIELRYFDSRLNKTFSFRLDELSEKVEQYKKRQMEVREQYGDWLSKYHFSGFDQTWENALKIQTNWYYLFNWVLIGSYLPYTYLNSRNNRQLCVWNQRKTEAQRFECRKRANVVLKILAVYLLGNSGIIKS